LSGLSQYEQFISKAYIEFTVSQIPQKVHFLRNLGIRKFDRTQFDVFRTHLVETKKPSPEKRRL